jgi:hypothetical protein
MHESALGRESMTNVTLAQINPLAFRTRAQSTNKKELLRLISLESDLQQLIHTPLNGHA